MNEITLGRFAFAFYTLIVLGGGVLAVTSPSLVRAMVVVLKRIIYPILARPEEDTNDRS